MIDAAMRRARFAAAAPSAALPLAGALAAAMTVLAGQGIKASGGRLGVFFPPFYMHWRPHAGPLAAVSIGVLGSAAALTPTWVRRPHRQATFAAALFALALALGVSLNVARGGVHELWAVFQTGPHGSHESYQEYLPGLPALGHGIGYYVKHFPALIPSLPIHVKGNPPGPLVALHVLGIDTSGALAALCIGIGALTAPLAYDLGRTLGGEERGRVAGVLSAFAPALLLLGVTSADYAFATLGLAAACLLVRDRTAARSAGAAAAAIGSFFSWLLFAIPAWAVLVILKRDGPRRAVELACLSAVATLALYATLAPTLGYDPIATLRATDAAYRHGISRIRPYAYWVLGSPVAWGISLGLPIGWAALRASVTRDPAAVALAAVVIAGAVLGFTKAETERIWLPFVPLACVAAGAVLPVRALRTALWLLAAQALAVELLFDTVW
jgi:methylthioxylose transferase